MEGLKEKRKFPRLERRIPVRLKIFSGKESGLPASVGEYKGVARNISAGGCYIEINLNESVSEDIFAKETTLRIRLSVAGVPMKVMTRIVRVEKSGGRLGLGTEFAEISEEENRRINSCVADWGETGERRQEIRRLVNIPVNCEYENKLFREYTKDISTGGMFLVTNNLLKPKSKISLSFSIPGITLPLRIPSRVANNMLFTYKNICMPTGMGVEFEEISAEYKKAIQRFVDNTDLEQRPELKIHFEPRFCYLYAMDLSIGCSHHCLYCHFSETTMENSGIGQNAPVLVDITSLYTMKNFPSTIFLSPDSDAFTVENKELAHEVLAYLLPKGINFIIVTKGIISDKTLELIKSYNNQFEGIAVGLTNLNNMRNKIIEPNCPPVEERLELLRKLVKTGVKNVRLRMDPIFPAVDDTDENLDSMVKTASEIGAHNITAAYIFSFGKYLKRLKEEPFLKESVKHITDKSPMQGGFAFTVPLELKERTYDKLFALCQRYNISFNTCGCKENRLSKKCFSLTCRNPNFYAGENK